MATPVSLKIDASEIWECKKTKTCRNTIRTVFNVNSSIRLNTCLPLQPDVIASQQTLEEIIFTYLFQQSFLNIYQPAIKCTI
jgi:hypothetical protein